MKQAGQDQTVYVMTKDQVEAALERILIWPEDRQQVLAEVALEIGVKLAGAEHEVTPDKLRAIDEGLAGEAASQEEVTAAFVRFSTTAEYHRASEDWHEGHAHRDGYRPHPLFARGAVSRRG
jgi:hypothetical protein